MAVHPKNTSQVDTSTNAIRAALDACADCDTCRFLMDEDCLFFPELYRLYDQEKEAGRIVGKADLRRLSELCTLCGVCPCPDIPMQVIRGKTERVQAEGLPLAIRLLADMQRVGRTGSLAPRILNRMLSFAPACRLAQKAAGIHPRRRLPRLPEESFFAWAHRRKLDRKPNQGPKVAYFAGCSAGYLFPEVARAAVAVLEQRGIAVFVPPQQCCGMPTLVEGDEKTTLRRARANMQVLLEVLHDGFDVVCSCPTCGFLMKVLLKQGAFYSDAYQCKAGARSDEIRVPDPRADDGFVRLKKSMYETILKDDGYFSSLDPVERIGLSESIMDVGAYLGRLPHASGLNYFSGEPRGKMVYYAPCHQREQKIGSPYLDLLKRVGGLRVESIGGVMDCCGMGGSLGFKKDFYEASIRLAAPLIQKIQRAEPDAIITDCLSCRLQFQHLLPLPVYHPLEILARVCENN